ncbi:MAG: cupin domain-containing protein [bacterium]|nr:cupin domain-containing protein [bacterium]
MKIRPIEEHEQVEFTLDGAREAKMRMLIGPEDGAKNFHMRHVEVGPGGCTPHHSHDYEHEILVLKGSGVATSAQGERPFSSGDVIFIPANERHQLVNKSESPCEFVCLIPAPEDCAR